MKLTLLFLSLAAAMGLSACTSRDDTGSIRTELADPQSSAFEKQPEKPSDSSFRLPVAGLRTNTRISNIDPGKIVSGGPGKDGIPALNHPKFVDVSAADLREDELGILVDFEGEERFYPYGILVWHEIVNDAIGDTSFAVTFCPLCGTAIVFSRDLAPDKAPVTFGVSGLLYESNLLMYDSLTESLWSQARGEAVVGDFSGRELERLPLQVLTFAEVRTSHPTAKVLSKETGYQRSYGFSPYGDYNESDEFLFHPSIRDDRFHPKKLMLVAPLENRSLAFPYEDIPQGVSDVTLGAFSLTLERSGNEIILRHEDDILVTYFEMFFSWAVHHQEDGLLWQPEGTPSL